MLPVAVGAGLALVVAVIGVIAFASGGSDRPVNNVSCDKGEQLAVHYHAHIALIYDGQEVNVPEKIGIKSSCFYWMHTHDTTGVIHIEAPQAQQNRVFTVGDFFAVWGQPLSASQVATLPVDKDHKLTMYVDGKPFAGDPKAIQLHAHTQVVLAITPPALDTPPTFTFPQGE